MSQIDLICSSTEEKDQFFFCCRGKIEIKYLFTWLLQNNLLGVEMFFEIQKRWLLYFKQHSSISEFILQQTQKRVLYFFKFINISKLTISS